MGWGIFVSIMIGFAVWTLAEFYSTQSQSKKSFSKTSSTGLFSNSNSQLKSNPSRKIPKNHNNKKVSSQTPSASEEDQSAQQVLQQLQQQELYRTQTIHDQMGQTVGHSGILNYPSHVHSSVEILNSPSNSTDSFPQVSSVDSSPSVSSCDSSSQCCGSDFSSGGSSGGDF